MRYLIFIFLLYSSSLSAQQVQFKTAAFKTGDDPKWADQNFDDKDWGTIKTNAYWENQGYDKYDGFAWYRIHFIIPSSLKEQAVLKENIEIFLGSIDDADITFLNGVEIGRTGRMPENPDGYKSGGRLNERHYIIKADLPSLHWDRDNVIAIRVYDNGGNGGMYLENEGIRFWDPVNYIKMEAYNAPFMIGEKTVSKKVSFQNQYSQILKGTLVTTIKTDDKVIRSFQQNVELNHGETFVNVEDMPRIDAATVSFVFTESLQNAILQSVQEIPYILTPKEKNTPQINNASLVGTKPNVPFLLKIAVTGERPISFSAKQLPKGLKLDAVTGIITGQVELEGEYSFTISAKNIAGKDEKKISLLIGNDKVLLTPPMGWNSWNCWGLAVSDERVKASSNAMINSGLINHGWSYMNIDDGWESEKRAADGNIEANNKFPDMKLLGDYLHSRGLKFGIYSSPGTTTCGGFLGSYQHEEQDVKTYAAWGVDYLKYDLCSYRKLYQTPPGIPQLQAPYLVMNEALKRSGRNIVYSLCEYGMGEVWKWGNQVGGNVWRTTGDITDNWNSLKTIGFSQEIPSSYNSNHYGFGDPDMLIVGYVGWGDHLHITKLSASEQYTHISLWSLLSAPLMLGCDLSKMDAFTYNLLSNDEVLAIDQDALGKGPKKYEIEKDLQIWVKDLADGNKAIGIFNLSESSVKKTINLKEIGMNEQYKIRDLWRQKNLAAGNKFETVIPVHGVLLLKITK